MRAGSVHEPIKTLNNFRLNLKVNVVATLHFELRDCRCAMALNATITRIDTETARHPYAPSVQACMPMQGKRR